VSDYLVAIIHPVNALAAARLRSGAAHNATWLRGIGIFARMTPLQNLGHFLVDGFLRQGPEILMMPRLLPGPWVVTFTQRSLGAPTMLSGSRTTT
jgi:hypothetical protein